MHHLTMFVVFITGIVLCMAGASYSNTCNCHCGHAYYGTSPDDSSNKVVQAFYREKSANLTLIAKEGFLTDFGPETCPL